MHPFAKFPLLKPVRIVYSKVFFQRLVIQNPIQPEYGGEIVFVRIVSMFIRFYDVGIEIKV